MIGGTFRDKSTGDLVDREKMMSIAADYLQKARKYTRVRVESWGLKCLDENGKLYFILFKARGTKYSSFSYPNGRMTEEYDEIFHVVDFEESLFGTLSIYACKQKDVEDLLFTKGVHLESNPEVTLIRDRDLKRISTLIEIRF